MRILICLVALLFSHHVLSNDKNSILLSQVQLYNLGVKLGSLKVVKNVPLLYAPAKVSIPPDQEYVVSASQSGLVSQLFVTVGDNVKKGELIAQIKSPELLSLQQQFLRANSERQMAFTNYQRDKKLLNEGIIARKRWQETRSVYNNRDSEVKEAKQLLKIAGMSNADISSLARTRRLNSQLNIYSPISGVVLERVVTVGERLDILAPLYRIANLEKLWLEIKLPQEKAEHVVVGDQVMVQNSSVVASIDTLGKSVDEKNQTVLARAIIENAKQLRAGQNVNTQIIQASQKKVFEVPNVAIAQNEGQAYLFVRTKKGFLVKAIEVIGKEKETSVITGELTGTEEIAVRGAAALKANWLGLGGDE